MHNNKLEEIYQIGNLLIHLSPEAVDYSTITEEKVIENFVKIFDNELIKLTLKEGRELLAMTPFPWEWVTDLVGSYWDKNTQEFINDPTFYHKWLANILKMLEDEARKQGKLN